MRIILIEVGRTTSATLESMIDEYVKRSKRFMPIEVVVIPELKNTRSLSIDQQKEREGEAILSRLQNSDRVVLLDEKGQEFTSVKFAEYLQTIASGSGAGRLVFVIGGPYGFSPAVYERGKERISLSKMTFSHQMIRLLFVEQYYRALTIIHHLPYHHE